MSEASLKQIEEEIEDLKSELERCKEAKSLGETCTEILKFTEKEFEPFTANSGESNPWHSNPKGAGGFCTIS